MKKHSLNLFPTKVKKHSEFVLGLNVQTSILEGLVLDFNKNCFQIIEEKEQKIKPWVKLINNKNSRIEFRFKALKPGRHCISVYHPRYYTEDKFFYIEVLT